MALVITGAFLLYSSSQDLARQYTLGAGERLKSRKRIEKLFAEGKTITASPYRVYYRLEIPSAQAGVFFGTGVSTRNFKKAVDRNRVKRLTREAFRQQKKPLEQALRDKAISMDVFFVYAGKELPAFPEVSKKMEQLLHKLSDKLNI